MRIVHAAGCDLRVSADADVIETDGSGHLFGPSTYLSSFEKKCQMPIDPPVSVSPESRGC